MQFITSPKTAAVIGAIATTVDLPIKRITLDFLTKVRPSAFPVKFCKNQENALETLKLMLDQYKVHHKKVLLVDKDKEVLDLLTQSAKDFGYRAQGVQTFEAMKHILSLPERPGILIYEYTNQTKRDYKRLVKTLYTHSPFTRVFITSHEKISNTTVPLAEKILRKPFVLSDVLKII
jgi:CheY-like chemotaxis protein